MIEYLTRRLSVKQVLRATGNNGQVWSGIMQLKNPMVRDVLASVAGIFTVPRRIQIISDEATASSTGMKASNYRGGSDGITGRTTWPSEIYAALCATS